MVVEDERGDSGRARPVPANAELALLLEVTGTPKPGNVDRHREYDDLRFEHFLTGAVGARPGFEMAADFGVEDDDADDEGDDADVQGNDEIEQAGHAPLGEAFETAIAGMARQSGGNTQFGAVLLLIPLVRAAATGALEPESASAVVDATTVEDTIEFYRAFEHVDVAVADPPEGMEPLDVRRGSDAAAAIEERDLTWADLMADSSDVDGVAAEWTAGFPRTFASAERITEGDGPIGDRASRAFLELLADEVDTFVVTQHDRETAVEVQERARDVLDGTVDPAALDAEFVERGINPGTTADIVAGGLFVALERGLAI